MKKPRRAGATETVGISVDPETKRKLKELAAQRHGGNVSALITEMTDEAVRQAAFERAWAWYGGPAPTEDECAAIDAELEEGWALAREHRPPTKKRSKKPTKAA